MEPVRHHDDQSPPSAVPAAQYVRMSTEHQQYSTANQDDVIRDYATKRGFEIVRTFADEGKSGLKVEGRGALKQLIAAVQSGTVDFRAILVYDVSRWGRFLDADESAYYEYLCKRAGIEVHYCAEQFENDGGPASTIIKSVKRAMAGEYSRELSSKVFQGQGRLIELGFRQGGCAGYGLRRMLLDANGDQKGILNPGDRKSLQTDRVVLVPGPENELQVVRQIFQWFVQDGTNEREIAVRLTQAGTPYEQTRSWSRGSVHRILTNEKYIGNNVWNRRSFKLKQRRVKNPPEMWMRRDGAFVPVVPPEQFYVARGIIQERSRRFSDTQMLDLLKTLFGQHGRVSGILIDETDGMPSSTAYRSRFGSLVRAYQLIGYAPDRDYRYLEINRALREKHPAVIEDAIQQLVDVGAAVERNDQSELLLINSEYTVSIVLSRCRRTEAGAYRWLIRFDQVHRPDITIVVRMNAINESALDYYVLPRIDLHRWDLRLAEFNGAQLDTYRCDSLEEFWRLARRAHIVEAP